MKSVRNRLFSYCPLLTALLAMAMISGCASIPQVRIVPPAAAVVVSGVGLGYVMLQRHQRNWKTYSNDTKLDRTISRQIKRDPELVSFGNTGHVNVTVFHGVVLLTGEVPREKQIARILDIAKSYRDSRQVINRIELAGKSNFNSRLNDSLLTVQVRTMLLDSEYIDGHKIKVVTERANVYLMGAVTRDEAGISTEIARSVSGVVRVVKVFEYL